MKIINEVLLIFIFTLTFACNTLKNTKLNIIKSFLEDYTSLTVKDTGLSSKKLSVLYAFYESSAKQIIIMNRPPKNKKNFLAKGRYDRSIFNIGY